ncbi:MAG: TerS protein [Gemmatimonadales bacterium]|nr:TerS protein [Gemmatimonadales bacterium]
MKPRQPRSDSIAAALVAAENAAQAPIEPPDYVDVPEAAKPFWRALMLNRPHDRWNAADLATAAVLARAQADVERLQREIDDEGDVVGATLNPKHRLLETIVKRIAALSRLLHVHAEATVGRAVDSVKPLQNDLQARATEHDDLIPVRRVA